MAKRKEERKKGLELWRSKGLSTSAAPFTTEDSRRNTQLHKDVTNGISSTSKQNRAHRDLEALKDSQSTYKSERVY